LARKKRGKKKKTVSREQSKKGEANAGVPFTYKEPSKKSRVGLREPTGGITRERGVGGGGNFQYVTWLGLSKKDCLNKVQRGTVMGKTVSDTPKTKKKGEEASDYFRVGKPDEFKRGK